MAEPIRVQRKRIAGWRMPPNTTYVGRPTTYGNPFPPADLGAALAKQTWYVIGGGGLWEAIRFPVIREHSPAANAAFYADCRALSLRTTVDAYRLALRHFQRIDPDRFALWIAPLRGKNLACWCRLDQPCHADVLLEIANG